MRTTLAAVSACVALTAFALPALAAYPERPVRLLVNSVPGGGGDIVARLLATELTTKLGQTVIVDTKPGAGGNIAGELIARADPDGYTLMIADSGPLVVNISLYKNMTFEPLKDFAPVARVASIPILVIVHPSLGVDSFNELVAKAKAAPGTIAYATPGVGSTQHLAAELLSNQVGMKLLHIPYKGGAPALGDVVAGHVPVGFIGIPPTAPHVRSGALKAVAITTPQRSPLLPDVSTLQELGVADYAAVVWFGIVAPKGTPPALVSFLNTAVNEILAAPEMKARLAKLGFTPEPATPDQFEHYMQEETLRWKKAVQISGAKNE